MPSIKKTIFVLHFFFAFVITFSQTNIFTLTGHRGNVNTLAFSKDGKYLVSGGLDSTIKVWNVAENFKLEKSVLASNASITSFCFSPSGTEVSVSSYQNFYIYKFPELKKLSSKKNAHTAFVKCANYSQNGEMIITTSWRDNSLILWKTKGLKKETEFPETEWTDKAIFINDKTIASVNHANTIKIWNVATGTLTTTLAGHTDWVYDLFVTTDGKYIVSASLDKTIKVWDLLSGKNIKTIAAHNDGICAVSISEDGKYFATASLDKTAKLWSLGDFSEIATFQGHEGSVLTVKFSPDGKYLATASTDKTIKIWDIQNLMK